MPLVIDWCQANAHPEEIALQAARALKEGQLVVLPTEVGYVLAALPTSLNNPNRPSQLPEEVVVRRINAFATPEQFIARSKNLTDKEIALAKRIWPGGVGWQLPGQSYPAWVPDHIAAGMVLDVVGEAAFFEFVSPDKIDLSAIGDRVAIMIDAGIPAEGKLTQVRFHDRTWSIERSGKVSQASLLELLARRIVFVCTGNTCRSPMAAALFRHRLAERLGCAVSELVNYGYSVVSAGVSATDNDPATAEAVQALGGMGVSLEEHRSQLATQELVARADDLIAMTRSHLMTLLSRYPVIAGNMRLLSGANGDLEDPFGSELDIYRVCAEKIQNHVDRLITEMGLS
jgi:protein-tyrosine-phosphatase/tRNA A37 threonylcarbamoyladenosine synthetase subunit TsaC/SUA5/YrdC